MAAPRKCLSTDDKFWRAVAESLSVRQVLSCTGLVPAGGNYKTVHDRVKRLALDTSHFTGAALPEFWLLDYTGRNYGGELALQLHARLEKAVVERGS